MKYLLKETVREVFLYKGSPRFGLRQNTLEMTKKQASARVFTNYNDAAAMSLKIKERLYIDFKIVEL
jgi:hypothetical protein